MKKISGFSKLSKQEKINWIAAQLDSGDQFTFKNISDYWHKNSALQKQFDEFSENTISNFYIPYSVVPNFVINDHVHTIPMAIEESSVVAACAKSAKFWAERGGFKSDIISTVKKGQVHFTWNGHAPDLFTFFETLKDELLKSVAPFVKNMEKRGGGISDMRLLDKTDVLDHFYQIDMSFETCDAMGANFINTILEEIGQNFKIAVKNNAHFLPAQRNVDIIMCILSNYTPDCIVRSYVECPIQVLGNFSGSISAQDFAERFKTAVDIATVDVSRAVTHNKGIFNGIDAVVTATGNDFRAVEACGHAYAARDGQYKSLTTCSITNGIFRFEIALPISLGTIGGLTELHPMARQSLVMLEYPDAQKLMKIVASVGLAQNFGALRSLVTTGIQKGHMKMHLLNILNQLHASESDIEVAKIYFTHKTVSHQAVREFLSERNDPKTETRLYS